VARRAADATAARKDHNRVTELDPSNYDARLIQGLHDYIVGSLPWTYRMLGFLVGFHGDKEKGIRTVEEVSQKGKKQQDRRRDAALRTLPARRKAQKALPLLEDLIRRFPRNNLFVV